MLILKTIRNLLGFSLICCLLTSCYKPPFNEFKSRSPILSIADSDKALIRKLEKRSIQVIQYGKTTTVIIPTDRYFVFDTAELNERCFSGLYSVKELIKKQRNKTIFVSAFTDNVGSTTHKQQLSRARAQTMLTFLWANGISAKYLHGTGFGDEFPVGNNQLIHGSAYNRRIEIQWSNNPCTNYSDLRSCSTLSKHSQGNSLRPK